MAEKQRILLLNGEYLPGYKGGGPIQSCANMVENLSDFYDFSVICSDRDNKDLRPYRGIETDAWVSVGRARVMYLSPSNQSLKGFRRAIIEAKPNVVYLNGFFSPVFTIKPLLLRRLGLLPPARFILAPRGDFTGGMENKVLKKHAYLVVSKLMGLYSDLLWHATSELEESDINRVFPGGPTFIAPNLPAVYKRRKVGKEKLPGDLNLIFVSRIFPKKNLAYALRVLSKVRHGKIKFDIYGPMEDREYWAECQSIIEGMPDNIHVTYKGELEHKDIGAAFSRYHAFLFPTLGENYGHVIVEAMMNGCPCVLSRGVTPWDQYSDALQLGAPLDEPESFVAIIERLVALNQQQYVYLLEANNKFVEVHSDASSTISRYIQMFSED